MSKMTRQQVYQVIDEERAYQDLKWGTPAQRPHEVGGWILLMQTHLHNAAEDWAESNHDLDALNELRQAIAVGIACCEQHGVPFRGAEL